MLISNLLFFFWLFFILVKGQYPAFMFLVLSWSKGGSENLLD